ncbi:MAG: hypothetical protein BGP06_21670 [Rhizobiales bacterium 65-9]|nr:MAG: hypothetical protein BGP06_21670 [Rhizobiales bacterium 65-9]
MSDCGNLLIVGASSVATKQLAAIVRATPGWTVTGLSRTKPDDWPSDCDYVSADLQDAESCRKAVIGKAFTHLVYAARAKHSLYTAMAPHAPVGIESVGPNLTMLQNIVEACEGPELRHVHVVAGGKWYGIHLGPFTTPARESDPGHMPPNFYFDHQRFLERASAERRWTWSTSRPNIISGVTEGFGVNLLSTLGVYAAICSHLGLPFDFPGKPGNFTSLQEMTESSQLAEAIFWMCRSRTAENQAFNVINGDLFRWETVWPRMTAHFGLKPGRVRHFSLVKWMADKGPVWDEIVRSRGLRPHPIDRVASWGFADFLLSWDYDVISSMTKIRQAGFHRIVDTEDMILAQLAEHRRLRILP